MRHYRIYQLKNIRDVDYAFMNFEYAKKHGFDLKDYKLVYEDDILDHEGLEDLFTIFNCSRPEDFHGHSMSVSDVVELDSKKFYCDSYGWVKL